MTQVIIIGGHHGVGSTVLYFIKNIVEKSENQAVAIIGGHSPIVILGGRGRKMPALVGIPVERIEAMNFAPESFEDQFEELLRLNFTKKARYPKSQNQVISRHFRVRKNPCLGNFQFCRR